MPARRQPVARGDEELAGEERRNAGNPGVRRLRDDHVVLAARQQQMRSAVADDQMRARIVERVLVGVAEVAARPRPPPAKSRPRRRAQSDDCSAAPSVTPLPRPMMPTSRGFSCSSSGRCATSLLRQHVAAVRRVHLAVDGERGRSGEPLDRDRGRCALAVVEQRAGFELQSPDQDSSARMARRGTRRSQAARDPTAR